MAIIKPFKGIRPAADKVAHVASRSYEDYSKEELKANLQFNPFSFLHIINPGFKFHKRVSGEERFTLVHNRYMEFLEEKVFIKDAEAGFYLYQINRNGFQCCGIFCATSVADYRNNIIKKHENTIESREQLFAHYLDTVKFNAEPVLMTYPDDPLIEQIIRNAKQREPDYFFTSPDRTTHQLWRIAKKNNIEEITKAFSKIAALYIADGHHRSASSDLFARWCEDRNPKHSGKEAYNFFMSYLIPESEIKIYEFNRMVKDLNGHSKESFLVQLDTLYRIKKTDQELYKPTKKHHFSMYLDGEFYSLYLRKHVLPLSDPLSKLDTHILFKTILEPILGIRDLRNDKRIQYGYGKHNVLRMKNDIDKGNFAVGFNLVPITMEEIKAVADAELVMPPKSTFIEPKLKSGLVIYEL